jgi:hypothetical protein
VPGGGSSPRWLVLLRPRWLCWHAFAVAGTVGMLWLGDWQLHRALAGNDLSWAYTFEWPLFTVFGWYFWGRTVRDELRSAAELDAGHARGGPPAGGPPDAAEETSEAYLARLTSEVRATHGKWHDRR